LAAGLLLLLLLLVALRRGPTTERAADRQGGSATQGSASTAQLESAANGRPGVGSAARLGASAGGWDPARGAPGAASSAAQGPAAAWNEMMEVTRATLLEKTKYPPTSLPLGHKTDLIEPNFVEPSRRPLSVDKDGKAGKIGITQWQDRVMLGDGDLAIATFTVMGETTKVPVVSVTRATLLVDDNGAIGKELTPLAFRDDGVAPDLTAGDGTFSGLVPPTAATLNGKSMSVFALVDLTVAGEAGQLRYHFISTGSPPAKFTGIVRDAIEGGSLAFHIGIDVYRAGRYSFMARVFDANDKPGVLLTAVDEYSVETRELVLVAFGKALLDQGLTPPFKLKNVEGFRYLVGAYPDREIMAILPGPFTSANFPLSQLSPAEWDSPDRWKRVDDLNAAIKQGPPSAAKP
jgi:hypothetical protein